MRAIALHVYPVKSMGGYSVSESLVELCGLAGDRRWAVVDEAGRKVTARECPELLAVEARPADAGGLTLTTASASTLHVPIPQGGEGIDVGFSRLLRAIFAGTKAANWLSAVTHRRVRLIWLDDPSRRAVDPAHGGRVGDVLSLADAGPLLATRRRPFANPC